MSQVYHDLIQYLYYCAGLFNKPVDLFSIKSERKIDV